MRIEGKASAIEVRERHRWRRLRDLAAESRLHNEMKDGIEHDEDRYCVQPAPHAAAHDQHTREIRSAGNGYPSGRI